MQVLLIIVILLIVAKVISLPAGLLVLFIGWFILGNGFNFIGNLLSSQNKEEKLLEIKARPYTHPYIYSGSEIKQLPRKK